MNYFIQCIQSITNSIVFCRIRQKKITERTYFCLLLINITQRRRSQNGKGFVILVLDLSMESVARFARGTKCGLRGREYL